MAPPHSYIDALKYTPVQLAEYLKYLDGNDTAYNEYFWWKPYTLKETNPSTPNRITNQSNLSHGFPVNTFDNPCMENPSIYERLTDEEGMLGE